MLNKRNSTKKEETKPKKLRKKKKFSFRNIKILGIRSGLDMPFLILVLLLVTIGLVMMFSASYPNAFYLHKGDSFFFIRNQAIFAVMGLALMLFVSKLNYQSLKILHLPILITSFVLLLLVLAMPPINGVRRWIQLGPIGFQPSEITKFAIILSFATLIDKNFE